MEAKQKLLENCRVLDFSNETGFLCGKIFGDLGADVIKVEKPGGDESRNVGSYYKDAVSFLNLFTTMNKKFSFPGYFTFGADHGIQISLHF